MATISERNRARLALRLLREQREPDAGDHVLIWARVTSKTASGRLVVTWDTQIEDRAFHINHGLVERGDVVLATPERPT